MSNKVNKKLIVLAGPTASGKTALAAELIKKYPMEIVSVDSRQVYKGLDIGTGKDKEVPQWMIDVVGPKESRIENRESRIKEECPIYSVSEFRDEAIKIIEDIWKRGKIPLVVGGTGFYIDSLIYEQNTNLTRPDAKVRAKLSKLSNDKLLSVIKKFDSETAAKIDPNNRVRLIRAAEIVCITKKPIVECEKKLREGWDINLFVLDIPRGELYPRIDKRVDDRIEQGMIKEVEGLLGAGVDPEWLVSLGLEYRYITRYLLSSPSGSGIQVEKTLDLSKSLGVGSNLISLDPCLRRDDSKEKEEMVQGLKFAIHSYARRQNTYFKRWENAKWLSADIIKTEISKLLREKQ